MHRSLQDITVTYEAVVVVVVVEEPEITTSSSQSQASSTVPLRLVPHCTTSSTSSVSLLN